MYPWLAQFVGQLMEVSRTGVNQAVTGGAVTFQREGDGAVTGGFVFPS
ncbi:hypothetical protein [Candidatus Thiothrix anitrata]|nr:hypothetical protein [Candidatus Thiothrix anitrata]